MDKLSSLNQIEVPRMKPAVTDPFMAAPESIPSYEDIVLGTAPWCLEAGGIFHGKTADEIFTRLYNGGDHLDIQSLLWVGPAAFRYYIRPVIRYCLTLGLVHNTQDGETEDPDSIQAVAGIIKSRLEWEPSELVSCAAELADFCRQIRSDFERFCAAPDIYVGLQSQFESLESELHQLS